MTIRNSLRFEQLEPRHLMAADIGEMIECLEGEGPEHDWMDVSQDGILSPLDVLIVINAAVAQPVHIECNTLNINDPDNSRIPPDECGPSLFNTQTVRTAAHALVNPGLPMLSPEIRLAGRDFWTGTEWITTPLTSLDQLAGL